MPIKAKYNIDDLIGEIYWEYKGQVVPSFVEAVILACMDTVNEAKQLNTYRDITGNLRSSIGFVVYRDGEEVYCYFQAEPVPQGTLQEEYQYETKEGIKTGFREVETGGDGEAGKKSGQEIAEEIAKKFPNGIAAVIVAGMDYSLWVESRGDDVISGPCLRLNSRLLENFRKIRAVFRNE
jgi:hypothetical protein